MWSPVQNENAGLLQKLKVPRGKQQSTKSGGPGGPLSVGPAEPHGSHGHGAGSAS